MNRSLTADQARSELGYYGLQGEDLEAAVEAYLERQEDGMAPGLAEFAEEWAAL